MLAMTGSRVCYRTIGRGVFHCERCGGDRPYRHGRAGAGRTCSACRWPRSAVPASICGAPICHTCYRVELLAVPTMDQMLVALLAGTRAAVLAMLGGGGAGSPAARRRGIELIRDAGAPDYDEGRLAAALARAPGGRSPAAGADGPAVGLRPALEAFSVQLECHAREWFLAKVVEVGLADGPLSAAERDVARTVARYLGMSRPGQDVISLAEQAAQAGRIARRPAPPPDPLSCHDWMIRVD